MDSVYSYYLSLMKETPHYIWEHSHITFWCSAICRLEKLWFLCQNQQQEGSSYSDILPRKHCRIVFEQQLCSKLFDTFISAFFLSNKITNHSVSLGGKKNAFSSCHLHFVRLFGNLQVFSICSFFLLWRCFVKFAKGFKWFRNLIKTIDQETKWTSLTQCKWNRNLLAILVFR